LGAIATTLTVALACSGQNCFATIDDKDIVSTTPHPHTTNIVPLRSRAKTLHIRRAPVGVEVVPMSEPKPNVIAVPTEEPMMAIPRALDTRIEHPHIESAYGVLKSAIDSAHSKLQVHGIVMPQNSQSDSSKSRDMPSKPNTTNSQEPKNR